MLITAILIIFALGYLAIALEHPLRINKAASALCLGTLLWIVWFIVANMAGTESLKAADAYLFETLGDTAKILFFLMGAMTIVAIIDTNEGFSVITQNIKTKNLRTLVWIVATLTFFLSAVIDNLISTIVMMTLVRKIVNGRRTRLYFAGLIIIVANSGGVWSPVGNITSTMLWIGGQVSASALVIHLFIPSLIAALIATVTISLLLKGEIDTKTAAGTSTPKSERNFILTLGLACIVAVPFIKTFFHVPPYIAMFLVLGIFWTVVEIMGRRHCRLNVPPRLNIYHIIKEVDIPSILFFAGILLAIGVLGISGQLNLLARVLNDIFGDLRLSMFAIGAMSSIVDNIPLVAATQGMYSLEAFPMDHLIWEFIAFNCGTGGSMLVIGSAAGIAAMGIDRNLTFGWYARKIAPIAALSYCVGAVSYLLIRGELF